MHSPNARLWPILALLTSALSAQDGFGTAEVAADSLSDAESKEPELATTSRHRVEHRLETGLGAGGRVAVWTYDYRLRLEIPADRRLRVTPVLAYRSQTWDFEGKRGLGGLDPWERVQVFSLGVGLDVRLAEELEAFILPEVWYTGEPRATFGRSIAWGTVLGLRWLADSDLELGVAVVLRQELDGDVSALPLPTFRWRFAEACTLTTSLGPHSTLAELAVDVTEDWTFAVSGGRFGFDFRLNGQEIGMERGWPVVGRLLWQPNETVSFDIFGGVLFEGRLELFSEHGRRLIQDDLRTAPVLGVQVYLSF